MSLIQKKRGSDLPQTPVGFDATELMLIGYRIDTGESVKFPMMNFVADIEADNASIVGFDLFDPDHEGGYSVGDVVLYSGDGRLHRFTSDHTEGDPWDASEVEDYDLEKEHQELREAIESIKENYARKVAGATNGNLAGLDADGNLTDSGIAASNVAQQDGYYKPMRVGLADNIVDERPFTEMGQLHMTASSVSAAENGITYPVVAAPGSAHPQCPCSGR